MLMSKPKPSEASVKAYREWSDLVDDRDSLNRTIESQKFVHGKAPTEVQIADGARIEARIKELAPIVERDFPV